MHPSRRTNAICDPPKVPECTDKTDKIMSKHSFDLLCAAHYLRQSSLVSDWPPPRERRARRMVRLGCCEIPHTIRSEFQQRPAELDTHQQQKTGKFGLIKRKRYSPKSSRSRTKAPTFLHRANGTTRFK